MLSDAPASAGCEADAETTATVSMIFPLLVPVDAGCSTQEHDGCSTIKPYPCKGSSGGSTSGGVSKALVMQQPAPEVAKACAHAKAPAPSSSHTDLLEALKLLRKGHASKLR